MRNWKSVLGVIGATVPIVYCGWLVYYFLDVSGSVQEAEHNGLGPTVLGLSVVGLLFCIPLAIKLIRIFNRPRPPGSGGDAPRDDEFDADAVIARYMARQSAEPANAPSMPTRPQSSAPAGRPGFGRKVR